MLRPDLNDFLAEVLPQCRYAKDLESLLVLRSDFYLSWTSDEVRLENYYHAPRTERMLTGVCYELTYQLGKLLQQQFESTYLFMAADGNCPRFYQAETSNHTFIVAIPWACVDDVVRHLSSGQPELPPEICLIDPSFQVYGIPGASSDIQDYTIRKVYDFEAISPAGDRCEVMPFQRFPDGLITTHTLPLGLLSHLAPELGEEEQLIVLGFQLSGKSSEVPVVFLGSKKLGELYPVIRRDWEVKLPPSHDLSRFLWRLREMLTEAKRRG